MSGEIYPLYKCGSCGWAYREDEADDLLPKVCYLCEKGIARCVSQEVWHPHSAQKRCDFHNGGFYFETFEELCWKERKCILTLCHKGEHELRLEREDETDEQYMGWYQSTFGVGAVFLHK